jgi:hypothetical protein
MGGRVRVEATVWARVARVVAIAVTAAVTAGVVGPAAQPRPALAQGRDLTIDAVTRVDEDTWRIEGDTSLCDEPASIQILPYGDPGRAFVAGSAAPTRSFSTTVTYAAPADAKRFVVGLECRPVGRVSGADRLIVWRPVDLADGPGATPEATPAPVNRRPVARDDSYRIPAGGTLRVRAPGVLANDRDPEGGALVAGWGAQTTLARATDARPDGSLVIRFPQRWNGRSCLAYQAIDPEGATSRRAFVRITVGEPADRSGDVCDLLGVEAGSAAPPTLARQARSKLRWEFLWRVGAPTSSSVFTLYNGFCRRQRGQLFVAWGNWWSKYSCWRLGPFQPRY